jgi:hypothetical protein
VQDVERATCVRDENDLQVLDAPIDSGITCRAEGRVMMMAEAWHGRLVVVVLKPGECSVHGSDLRPHAFQGDLGTATTRKLR